MCSGLMISCCIPAHQDPNGTFWGIFILIDLLLYLFFCIRTLLGIMPIPVHCELRPLSRASLAVGLIAWHKRQGTNTHDLCGRSIVTRLVIYPVTLCMICTAAVNFML